MAQCPECGGDLFCKVKGFGRICYDCDLKIPDTEIVLKQLDKKSEEKTRVKCNWNDFEGEMGW